MKEYVKYIKIIEKDDLYKKIEDSIKKEKKMFIVTANSESYILAKKDKVMDKILKCKENLIIPDSISISFVLKRNNIKVKPIAGVDIAKELIEICSDLNKKIYFFGSEQKNLDLLTKKLKKDKPKLKIVGARNGFDFDEKTICKEIKNKEPDVILVALGIPRQEKFIDKYYKQYNKGIFIGVGGSLDVISGFKRRAPKIFIKLRLEWLYRILKEPKRIKRFIKNNIVFVIKNIIKTK